MSTLQMYSGWGANRIRVEKFPGFSALQLLHTIQNDLERKRINPEEFSDRIIFMSMFNDIDLEKRGNEDTCALTKNNQRICLKNQRWTLGIFWDSEKKISGTMIMRVSLKVNGTFVLQRCWAISRIRDIHCLKGVSPLGRGILKKTKGKDTIHFNGEYSNVDLLHGTVHSANQLCIHGAVTKWCETQSGTDSGKRSNPGYESAPRTLKENDMKRGEPKSLVDIPKLTPALGSRMLQNMKGFESMRRGSQIEFLRTTAGFCHPVEVGRRFSTILHKDDRWGKCTSLCKEYTQSPETTRIRDRVLRLMHTNGLVQS